MRELLTLFFGMFWRGARGYLYGVMYTIYPYFLFQIFNHVDPTKPPFSKNYHLIYYFNKLNYPPYFQPCGPHPTHLFTQ